MPSGTSETAAPGVDMVGKNFPTALTMVAAVVVLLPATLEECRDNKTPTAAAVRMNALQPRIEIERLDSFRAPASARILAGRIL